MADSTPFPSTDSEPPPHEHHPSLSSTIEHCIGDFNLSQFLQVLLVSFAWAFDAQQTFIGIFTHAEPPWHCTQHDGESCNSATSNMCNLPKSSWAWDRPSHAFIISERTLEC
ncbi:hypothetical protein L6164_018092 [Bauhinia variegata]|uniref:Uncharacterized protein n=1 Tax=Bauhinia variegata TaxID=167791 RepID=A0ACB9NC27_BAUVA|nr:hypothetical protein L6164_018092 [Bauhinia variegata]